jgi:hypothetical protein
MTKIFDTKFTSILVAAAISLASSSAALAHHSLEVAWQNCTAVQLITLSN